MPFTLSGSAAEYAAGDAASGRLSSSAAGSDTLADCLAPVDCLPPVFLVETFREELLDAAGKLTGYRETMSGPGYSSVTVFDAGNEFVSCQYRDSSGYRSSTVRETLQDSLGITTGYRETSVGEGSGFSYESVTDYDSLFNLVAASYSDNSGYRSTTTRSELRDSSGVLSGYQLISSGGGNGYSYESTETFDTSYNLLTSAYSDGNGYRSTYRLQIERDGTGAVTGYVTTCSWTDGTSSYSTNDRYDAAWNYVGGDSSRPDGIVDDGPMVLPVVSQDTESVTRVALASAESVGSQALDGGSTRGARLAGSNGDDMFIVDDTRDRVSGSGAGDDTVLSSTISLDLRRGAFKDVENATLMGRDDLDLRGDSGGNALYGNAGENRLDGRHGSDTLFGGLGEDVFVTRAGQKGAADSITDFTSGEDTIALSGRAFRGLFDRSGVLKDGAIGERLLFDASSGELSFDRDGAAGSHSAEVIAVLIGVDAIHASDFVRA